MKAVIAESFERIHRSNLVGMGVLPLQFLAGQNRESLGLDRHGDLSRRERHPGDRNGKAATVHAVADDGAEKTFEADRSHRYAAGTRILPQWRHSPLRLAPSRERSSEDRIGFVSFFT